MVKHANQVLQNFLNEERDMIEIFGSTGWMAINFRDQYDIYYPSFMSDFSVRTSKISRSPRWVGKGEFDIKGLSFTDVSRKPFENKAVRHDPETSVDSLEDS